MITAVIIKGDTAYIQTDDGVWHEVWARELKRYSEIWNKSLERITTEA